MRSPIHGLMKFSFYALSKKTVGVMLLWTVFSLVILGALFGSTGNLIENLGGEVGIFVMIIHLALFSSPYTIMMYSEDTTRWERYQLAMPVKRSNLAATYYLSIAVSQLASFVVVGLIVGIGFILYGDMGYLVTNAGFRPYASGLGMIWLMAALLYPLGSTEFGGNNQPVAFFISMAFGIGGYFAVLLGFHFIGLEGNAQLFATLAFSLVLFVVSILITAKLMAKGDF